MDYIAEPLRTLAVPIAELHEDPANARKGHAVEISPAYCAVAIERWATHTGGAPELLP